MFKTNSNAVGHYILGKSLGEGTFGKVKMGTHILTGEKVAVKVLEKSKIKDKKDVERISREIKILKQTHHPNVVQLYEIIETDKDLYLIMEFSSGGELFDIIVTNQKLKEELACKYFQELVAAIDYIHSLGICHRDLKPENLLIDYDGTLKMVDFGLSNMYELPQGLLKTACGSPCYAAPEMIAGNQYYGLKSDLWSCGVVLYAMLCGYLPYEDQKTSNLYKKILSAEYAVPKFLSEEAKDLIAKIFITNPDERIDVEGIRKHPWFAIHQPECQSFGAARNLTAINQKIVNQLEQQLGFNKESLIKSIKNNKHNHLTATYYLLLKKLMMKQNRPYLHAFQQNAEAIAKFSRVRHKQTLRDKGLTNNPETEDSSGTVGKGLDQVSNFNLTAPTVDQLVLKNHRREKSQNPTSNAEVIQSRYQALADRKAESCERAPADDDYEIILENGASSNEKQLNNSSLGSPDVIVLKTRKQASSNSQQAAQSLNQTQKDFSHLHKSSDGRKGRAATYNQHTSKEEVKEQIQIRNLNYSHQPTSGANKQSTKKGNANDDIIKITDEAVAQNNYEDKSSPLDNLQYSKPGVVHRKANSFSESVNSGGLSGSGQKVKIKNFQQQENLKNLMNNIAQITKKVKERGHSNDPHSKQDTTVNYSKLNQTFHVTSTAQSKGKPTSKIQNENGSSFNPSQGAYPIFNMQLLSQGQSNLNDSRESTHKNSNSMFAASFHQPKRESNGASSKQSRVISTVNGMSSNTNQSFDKANSSLVNGLQMNSFGLTQQQQQLQLSGTLGIKLTHASNARTHSNQSPHIQNQMALSKTSQQSSRNQSKGVDRSYQNYDISRQLMGYNLTQSNGRPSFSNQNNFSNGSNYVHNTEPNETIGTGTSFENLQKHKKRGLSGPQQIPQLSNFGTDNQQQVFQMPRISNYLPPQNLNDSIVSRHSYAHPQPTVGSYNSQSLNQSISMEKSKHRRASNNMSYTLNSGAQPNGQASNGRNHSHGFAYHSVNPNQGASMNSQYQQQQQQILSQNQTRPLKNPIQIQQDLNISDLYSQYQNSKHQRVRNSSQINKSIQQNANIASNSFMNTGINYLPPASQVNMNNSFHIAPTNYSNQVNLNFSGPHYQTQSYNQNVSDQMKKTFYPRNSNTVSNAPALNANPNFQGVMNQINNSYLSQTSGSNQTVTQSPEQHQKYNYSQVMRTTTTTSTTNPRASSTSYYTQGNHNINVQSQPSNPLVQLQNLSQPHHQRNNSSGGTATSVNHNSNNINSSKLPYAGQNQAMLGGQPTVQNNIQNLIFTFPNNQQETAMRL